MGTWGDGPFDDDGAMDWVWELQESTDWSVVEAALRAVTDAEDDYVEAPDGQIAWAAAAVVAAAATPSIAVPVDVAEWLDRHRVSLPGALRPLALQAVRRVLADDSELVDLWEESGGDAGWRASVERVATALG